MTESFQAEIRMFAGTFAPRGNALCDGQLLAIAQNQALFSLLGTTFGGDGRTTFGLPDMRGRIPLHEGTGPGLSPHNLGSKGGVELVVLDDGDLPAHTHAMKGSKTAANSQGPAGEVFADAAASVYTPEPAEAGLAAAAVGEAGSDQPHNNMQPYLAINFIVALVGIYPSRN